jgi:patatin-like phospholipase/acyl hydrolase
MNKSKWKKATICDIHDYIKDKMKFLNDCDGFSKKTKQIFKDIQYLAELAKYKGQRMENRMTSYREAIEGLGFERL